jgi:hypothetical protein
VVSVARARAAVAAGAVLLALVVVTNVAFDDPTFVDRLSFENPTDYAIRIEVAGEDGSTWMPLGVATQHCRTSFDLVIDQGSTWQIRFFSQAREGGQVSVERADLERSDWTFQVPDSVAAELTSRQAPLPPARGCAT